MKPSELIHKTLEYYETHDWLQNQSFDYETGAGCLSGVFHAILIEKAARDLTSTELLVHDETCQAITDHTGYATIVSYNDKVGRTFDQVRETLKLTAETLELEGR